MPTQQFQFFVDRHRYNIDLRAADMRKSTLTIGELRSLAQDHPLVAETFAAAIERRDDHASEESPAQLIGVESFADFRLLELLRKLYQQDPSLFANAEFTPTPLHAHIQYAGDDQQHPFILSVQHEKKTLPIDTKDVFIFGSDTLWGYYKKRSKHVIFEVDLAHPNVLTPLNEHHGMRIPKDYITGFLQRNYYDTGLLGRVHTPENEVVKQFSDVSPIPRIYLDETEEQLHMTLFYSYNGQEVRKDREHDVHYCENTVLAKILRDRDEEEKHYQALLQSGIIEKKKVLQPKGDALLWLADKTSELISKGFEIYGHEKLLKHKIAQEEPEMRVSARTGQDWIELDVDATVGGEPIPLEILKSLLMKRERFVKLSDGRTGAIPKEWITKLSPVIGFLDIEDDSLQGQHAQVPLIENMLDVATEVETSPEFDSIRTELASFENIEDIDIPEHLNGTLRNYQKEGYNWLRFLNKYKFGGLLADQMGLGKTLQTLTLLLHEHTPRRDKKTLIIVPTSLVHNWKKEMGKFTPTLIPYIHHGSKRFKSAEKIKHLEADIVITTYNTVFFDQEIFSQLDWHYVVLDEAQYVKNPGSKTARFIRSLEAEHRLAITGTPIENNSMELWSHFAFLNPGLLGNVTHFKQEYARHLDDVFSEEKAALLKRVTKPFVMQRRKESVAKDLPPKQIIVRYHDMEPKQAELYDHVRRAYQGRVLSKMNDEGMKGAQTTIFEGLLRLRQIANHPIMAFEDYESGSGKFTGLCEQIRDVIQEGHKVLVFSSFLGVLKMLQDVLNSYGIQHVYLDGSTKNRQELVDKFQEDIDLKAFLISLKAGGVGLTLTAADYVFVVDPWWNPAAEMQAIDRAHRIGQKNPVFVYKMISRGTVEEKILDLQHQKMQLQDTIITMEDGIKKHLTTNDIAFLFE